MNKDQLTKWQKWIGDGSINGSILNEASNISLVRRVHSELRDMVNNNEKLQKPSAFYSVSSITYGQTLLMFIRRHVKLGGRDSRGLIDLLTKIKGASDQFTESDYIDLFTQQVNSSEEAYIRAAKRDFSENFSENTPNTLSINIIEEDIKTLENINQSCETFIDKRLAHLDKQEIDHLPTVKEIEEWCDAILTIIKKYKLLLSASEYQLDVTLSHDWKEIFRTKWIDDQL